MIETSTILIADSWITDQLGKPSYRLVPGDGSDFIDRARAGLAELAGTDNRCFVSCKAGVDEYGIIEFLSKTGFNLIESAITLEKPVDRSVVPSSSGQKYKIRSADSEDENCVVKVASGNIIYSRFHTDRRIGKKNADRLKGEWARNYFKGLRGDGMVLAEKDDAIVGFLQYFQNGSTLAIDLIAVDKNARREGIAESMIDFAQTLDSVNQLVVGTQLANIPSMRLYEKLGFRIIKGQYVFHLHEPE